MSRLIPTPVMDKNGRLTTVHKRIEPRTTASSLSTAKPSIGGNAQQVEPVNLIKPKKLTTKSDAVRVARAFGYLSDNDEISDFIASSGRSAIKMADDEIYDGLRRGFSVQDAAAIKSLGISLDDVAEKLADDYYRGKGSMNTVDGRSYTRYTRKNENAIDRLQEAGVPALTAEKVISNGLEDAHLDRGLNDEQLLELFSKYKFRSTCSGYQHGHVEQDDVIEGFVSGDLPFELMKHKVADLKNLAREVHDLKQSDPNAPKSFKNDPELAERIGNRDYLLALSDKAASMMSGQYRALSDLDAVVQKHGMEALELKDPRKATMTIFVSAGVSRECGIEAARYVEKVLDLAEEDTMADFWGTSSDPWTSMGSVQTRENVYLRNYELLSLYEAGVPAEETYDLMVKHKLSSDQILVVKETGVASTIAEGVL